MNNELSSKVSAIALKIVDDAIASGERFTAKMANDAIAEAIEQSCKKQQSQACDPADVCGRIHTYERHKKQRKQNETLQRSS